MTEEQVQNELNTLAAALRSLDDEVLAEVLDRAQITSGWVRLKKDRILPLTSGNLEVGTEGWYRQAETLALVPLGSTSDDGYVAEITRDGKFWVTDAYDENGAEVTAGFESVIDALAAAEEYAEKNGWVVRFGAFGDDEDEDEDEDTADEDTGAEE
jgi:hypothetical protein